MNADNEEPWFSQADMARIVDHEEDITWDETTDFVVVGSGAAGSSAAAEAREHGQEVMLIDRYAGGGASAASGGVLYAGGGTCIQRACQVDDSPSNMFAYLKLETQGCVRDSTLQRFCEQSRHTVDWLMAKGVEFKATLYAEKTSYPNIDYFLYHSDNSLVPAYAKHARPAARGHRGAGRLSRTQMLKATGLGGSIVWPLHDWLRLHGIALRPYTEARQLILNRDGRVLGVKLLELPAGASRDRFIECHARAQKWQERVPPILPGARYLLRFALRLFKEAAQIEATARLTRYVKARRGVCLAAGGFVFNRRMLAHHAPKYVDGYPLGTLGDDGSSIHLGRSAGGATDRMGNVSAWRFINPPKAWAQGVIVNASGARIVNEMVYGATLGYLLAERHAGRGWLILDAALVRAARAQIEPGKTLAFQRDLARLNLLFGRRKARSLPRLATLIGVDGATLQRTIDSYNAAARGDCPDEFGKTTADCAAIIEPPFMAIDVGLAARLLPCPTLTLGGLVVDEDSGVVLRPDGSAVAGLYAAGRTAIGVSSGMYVSGLSIADGVFSGRRAGLHVATGTVWSPSE